MISETVINRAAFLDALASRAPAVTYLLGVVLLLRRFLGVRAMALVGLAVAALFFLAGVEWLVRRRYDRDFARAWYDRTNAAGGRILAGNDAFPLERVPALSGRFLISRLIYPGFFLLVVCLVPPPEWAREGSGAGIGRAVQATRREIQEAATDKLITERQRENLTAQIERVREMVREDRREAAAEALAAVQERLKRASRETVEETRAALEQAGTLVREYAEAEQSSDDGRRQAAADGLAALEESFRLSEQNGIPGENESAGNAAGRDTAAFLSALEEHGRHVAEAARRHQTGSSGSASTRDGREQGAGVPEAGEGGGAASQLETASEALAELLRNSSLSVTPEGASPGGTTAGKAAASASGDASGTAPGTTSGAGPGAKPGRASGVTAGSGPGSLAGTAPAGTAGTGSRTQRSGGEGGAALGAGQVRPGSGGTGRGRSDAPLILGDISRRHGESVRFTPLTPTGQSNHDGPELRRERTRPDPDDGPEARRESSRSAFDPPEGAAAGRGSTPPGPSRGRWVDDYFEALEATK